MPDLLRHIGLSAALLLLWTTGDVSAQPSSLSVAVTGGYRPMPSYLCQPGPENKFSPELQIESRLATFADQTLSAHGALYYAYWNDGVSKLPYEKLCSHGMTYSYREHTAGIRIFVAGEKGFLPVMVSTGLARQFAFSDYIGGDTWGGAQGQDYSSTYTRAEVGLHIRFPVGERLKLQGGVQRSVRIPTRQHIIEAFLENARRVYQIGIVYTL